MSGLPVGVGALLDVGVGRGTALLVELGVEEALELLQATKVSF